MITQIQEVSCDACGATEHFHGSRSSALLRMRKQNWTVTRSKKHYCNGDGCGGVPDSELDKVLPKVRGS